METPPPVAPATGLNNTTVTPASSTPANAPTPTANSNPTAAAAPSSPTAPNGITMSKTPPRNPTEAAQQLTQALELALKEMRAAQQSDAPEQVRLHSQASLNVLVGQYGRWYSTPKNDPSNRLGVLPGETQPQGGADLGGMPQPTIGLALLTMGTSTTPSPELVTILGDVNLWRTKPRAGYDSIANAVDTANTAQMQLGELAGSVPRAVAWQRLVLTQSSSIEQTRGFTAQAISELERALAAARALAR